MKDVKKILSVVEETIKDSQEKAYFLIHSVRYYRTLCFIEEISQSRSLKILDIGCFPYHIGSALEMMQHNVFGISSSHEPIHNQQIAVINIEKDRFPFKDNFFDLVLCNEVIEHLPQSPIPPLEEIYRVTKKDGHVMITTPNIVRSINRGKLLLGKSIMFPLSVYFEKNGKGNNIYHRHNREYTLSELETLLLKTKWRIAKKQYFISYTPFRKRPEKPDSPLLFLGKYINYLGMLTVPSAQDTLFVLGEK